MYPVSAEGEALSRAQLRRFRRVVGHYHADRLLLAADEEMLRAVAEVVKPASRSQAAAVLA